MGSEYRYGDLVVVEDETLIRKGVTELTAGVIDRNAVAAFTQGWCWALALALEEIAGWEIIVVYDARGFWLHAGGTPDGGQTVIDIEGAADASDWQFRWAIRETDVVGVRPLDERERYTFGWLCGSNEEQAMAVARVFAGTVIGDVGPTRNEAEKVASGS